MGTVQVPCCARGEVEKKLPRGRVEKGLSKTKKESIGHLRGLGTQKKTGGRGKGILKGGERVMRTHRNVHSRTGKSLFWRFWAVTMASNDQGK